MPKHGNQTTNQYLCWGYIRDFQPTGCTGHQTCCGTAQRRAKQISKHPTLRVISSDSLGFRGRKKLRAWKIMLLSRLKSWISHEPTSLGIGCSDMDFSEHMVQKIPWFIIIPIKMNINEDVRDIHPYIWTGPHVEILNVQGLGLMSQCWTNHPTMKGIYHFQQISEGDGNQIPKKGHLPTPDVSKPNPREVSLRTLPLGFLAFLAPSLGLSAWAAAIEHHRKTWYFFNRTLISKDLPLPRSISGGFVALGTWETCCIFSDMFFCYRRVCNSCKTQIFPNRLLSSLQLISSLPSPV